jgi:hypothetical protein
MIVRIQFDISDKHLDDLLERIDSLILKRNIKNNLKYALSITKWDRERGFFQIKKPVIKSLKVEVSQ